MAHRGDTGAPLMFGLRVRVLPGGSAMPRIIRGDAEQEGLKHQRPGLLDSGSHCICMESGGSCLDHDNKDSC